MAAVCFWQAVLAGTRLIRPSSTHHIEIRGTRGPTRIRALQLYSDDLHVHEWVPTLLSARIVSTIHMLREEDGIIAPGSGFFAHVLVILCIEVPKRLNMLAKGHGLSSVVPDARPLCDQEPCTEVLVSKRVLFVHHFDPRRRWARVRRWVPDPVGVRRRVRIILLHRQRNVHMSVHELHSKGTHVHVSMR